MRALHVQCPNCDGYDTYRDHHGLWCEACAGYTLRAQRLLQPDEDLQFRHYLDLGERP